MTIARPVAEHQHGTTTGYGYGCRCVPCVEARAAYRRLHKGGARIGRPATLNKRPRRACAECGEPTARRDKAFCSIGCANAASGRDRRFEAQPVPRAELLARAGGLSPKQLLRILHDWQEQGAMCEYCGGPCETTDHVVPLIRGGENTRDNLVPACLSCNSSKGSKLLSEWRCPNAA